MDKRLARAAHVMIMVMRHSTKEWTININSNEVILYWETPGIDYGRLTYMITMGDHAFISKRK